MCRSRAECINSNRTFRRCNHENEKPESRERRLEKARENRKRNRTQRRAFRYAVRERYGKDASDVLREVPPSQLPYMLAYIAENDPEFSEQLRRGVYTEKPLVSMPDRGKGLSREDMEGIMESTQFELGSYELAGMHHASMIHTREDTDWDTDGTGVRKGVADHTVAQMALYEMDRARLENPTDPAFIDYFGGDPNTDPDARAVYDELAARVEAQRAGVAAGAYGVPSGARDKALVAQAQASYHEFLAEASDEEIAALTVYGDAAERHMREEAFKAATVDVTPREVYVTGIEGAYTPDRYLSKIEEDGGDTSEGVEVADGVTLYRDDYDGATLRIAVGGEGDEERFIHHRVRPGRPLDDVLSAIPAVTEVGIDRNAKVNPAYRGVVERDLGLDESSQSRQSREFRDDIREQTIRASLNSKVPTGTTMVRNINGIVTAERNRGKAKLGMAGAVELGMDGIGEFEARKHGAEADLAERYSRADWARELMHARRNGIRRDFSPLGKKFTMSKAAMNRHRRSWEKPLVTEATPSIEHFKSMGLDDNVVLANNGDGAASDKMLSDSSIDGLVEAANRTLDPSSARRRRYVPGASESDMLARRLMEKSATDHFAERADAARRGRGYAKVTTSFRGNADTVLAANSDGTFSPTQFYAGASKPIGRGETTFVVTGTSTMHTGNDRAIINPRARYVISHEEIDEAGRNVMYLTEAGDIVDDQAK